MTDRATPEKGLPEPYYSDESVTLYHGDCRPALAAMADRSVDLVIPARRPDSRPIRRHGDYRPRMQGRGSPLHRVGAIRTMVRIHGAATFSGHPIRGWCGMTSTTPLPSGSDGGVS